ncbi:unnamed protein product [Sphenostylis stenocarpa]|uniref:Uncharacterized protein n=1 Tax=Sphenostylis stenocarpa TaxID=92480 RepID=A0AA86VSP0_9FABA|nr:unnamed protein product [Sphenostylis stenocarpa]
MVGRELKKLKRGMKNELKEVVGMNVAKVAIKGGAVHVRRCPSLKYRSWRENEMREGEGGGGGGGGGDGGGDRLIPYSSA